MKLLRGFTCVVVAMLAASLCMANSLATLKAGKADLKSAGPLAFGPDGILFVGDTLGASVYAIDTGDRTKGKGGAVEVKGVNEKVAALLGTAPDQILVNDMAVNPISKNVYLSVSRGRGPDATPVIVRVTGAGKVEDVALVNIGHSKIGLPNAPAADAKDRRGTPLRLDSITDIAYVDGKVIVAGLSNEEFASNLRAIPFPFASADNGAAVEIFHGAHGRFETNAPVRTFVPYQIQNEQHILAAYQCTPLVAFKVSELAPGKKVTGKTLAELGNRNRPLDMIVYKKGGARWVLMNNSSRGVMKVKGEGLETYQAITAQTDITGVPYETIADLKGVQQLDAYDDNHAMLLIAGDGGAMELKTIALP
jgi:hypothetical protein